ncbi:MAG: TIGR02444 family protein [Pseudomonadota bacterium]|nr:MAG: TIGR02444 family protein [Pseudomonadota bacterium]
MSESTSGGLWCFSLECYGHQPVEDICLQLQDRYALNVNVMLCCCWLGFSGRGQVAKRALQDAIDAIALWHDRIVLPLRVARRTAKAATPDRAFSALYKELLRSEVAAEHVEQLLLELTLRGIKPCGRTTAQQRRRDARRNLAIGVRLLGASSDSPLHRDLDALVETIAALQSRSGRAAG